MADYKDFAKKQKIDDLKAQGKFAEAAKLDMGLVPDEQGKLAAAFTPGSSPADVVVKKFDKPVESTTVTLAEIPETKGPAGPDDPLKYLRAIPKIDLSVEKAGLDKNQKKIYEGAEQIKGQIEDLVAMNNLSNNALEKKELTEKIAQAVGLITGGIVGLNTGLDMGGLKFNSTDWEREANKVRNNFQTKLGAMKEKYGVDDNTLQNERKLLLQKVDMKEGEYRRGMGERESQMSEIRLKELLRDKDKESVGEQGRQETAIRQQAEAFGRAADKLQNDWQKAANRMSKLSGEAKKTAVREMERLDEDYETLTGTTISADPKAYIEATENDWQGAGYGDLTQLAAQKTRLLEDARKADPVLNQLITNRDTLLKKMIRAGVDANLPIEEATQKAYANYKKNFNARINKYGEFKAK